MCEAPQFFSGSLTCALTPRFGTFNPDARYREFAKFLLFTIQTKALIWLVVNSVGLGFSRWVKKVVACPVSVSNTRHRRGPFKGITLKSVLIACALTVMLT